MKRPDYPTLDQLGMGWVVHFEMSGRYLFIGFVILGFVMKLLGFSYLPEFAAIGFACMISLEIIHYWIFYNQVKCPACSGKLNRFKTGRNVPIKQAHTQLSNGYGCRHCGWKPRISVED